MSFWKKIFRSNDFRCSNCNALIFESTFQEKEGQCGLCARDPEVATKRWSVAESQKAKGIINPQCGKCGVSESQRHRDLAEAEKLVGFVYGKDYPCLLYCDSCDKYFCGQCQADLGMDAGCPRCGGNLESPVDKSRDKKRAKLPA